MLRLVPFLLLLLFFAAPAQAFVIWRYALDPCPFPCPSGSNVNVERSLREAPRWDAGATGFADGLRVGIAPGFADAFAANTPLLAEDYEQGVVDAFSAWQTADLGFDITFDTFGSQIRLSATSARVDPNFQGNSFSGLAFVHTRRSPTRLLTSGVAEPGHLIHSAEILIATDRVRQTFAIWELAGILEPQDRLDRFTNLLMHEIGHALGLRHPNESPELNFDDDGDPFSVFEPDPLAPWEGLALSETIDPNAIMRGGAIFDRDALISQELFADDRSGLNLLYPSVPEPSSSMLVVFALAALAGRRAETGYPQPDPSTGRTSDG